MRIALVLSLSIAAFQSAGAAGASPDPLSERKKPTLDHPPAAPPPAGRTGGAKTGTTSTATANPGATPAVAGDGSGATAGVPGGARVVPGGDGGNYRLGPKDKLRVEVWNRAEVEYEAREVTVTDEGTISLPLLDKVKVAGRSVSEITDTLKKAYNETIIDPQVFIQMLEYNSRVVNVVGEVKNPGIFALKGEMALTDVLAMAGDRTNKASSTVRILRPAANGSTDVIDVDLARIGEGNAADNIKVHPGDEIRVLPNHSVVYVKGMVKGEGFIEYEEGLTAQQAVILSGGIAEGGSGKAKVFREVNGKVEKFDVNVNDLKRPFTLLPNDIIQVPKSIL